MSAATIQPLHLADVAFPEGHPRGGETGPVYGFLVTGQDSPLLVDTGIDGPHPLIDQLYRPVRYPLLDVLARIGIRPADIGLIINTHLHFDHCGGNRLFPGTPILVQTSEYEAAREPDYTIREWVSFPGADYRLIEGGLEVGPGVRIVATPGHTPGHQSVLIDTDDGLVIIAGQAAETASNFEAGHDPSRHALIAMRPSRVFFSHDHADWRPA